LASVSPSTSRLRPAWLPHLLLVASIALAYAGSLRAPFIFDDAGAVINNPTIRRLGSLDIFRPLADGSTTTGRPLVNASFALNYAISGDAPWSYHALNIAIHACAALALFGLLRRTLARIDGRAFRGDSATGAAFVAAALWALHPLLTESVVCVAQRTESLCGLFYLLTLYAFARALESARAPRRWHALSIVACALGMAAKEVMVTAPLVVLLYDRTFVAGGFRAAWRARRSCYLGLAGTWLVLALLVLGSHGTRGASAGFGLGVSWWSYLLKQAEAIVRYLGLSLWPHPLVLDYGTAVVQSVGEVAWELPLVILLFGATLWAGVRRPRLGFVGACFFLILAPSSSVVPLVTQTMAEHRMYLPLAAIVSGAVAFVWIRLGKRAGGLCVVAALALAGGTAARVADYRDPVSIWRDNVAKFPQAPRGHNNLALALQQQGRFAEAGEQFARAVALDPDYITARYDWGVELLDHGRLLEAIEQFAAAVRLAPDYADAHLNLGTALLRAGRAAEAVPHFETALHLAPAADAHYNLGVALVGLGRDREAAEHFQSALRLNPRLPAAQEQFHRTLEKLNRDAVALAQNGQLEAAAEQLRAILHLLPEDADAHANLGNVLLLGSRPREALAEFEQAARLRPDDAQLREILRAVRERLP
jgi:tetratricopeptide (TPR) repeat protein